MTWLQQYVNMSICINFNFCCRSPIKIFLWNFTFEHQIYWDAYSYGGWGGYDHDIIFTSFTRLQQSQQSFATSGWELWQIPSVPACPPPLHPGCSWGYQSEEYQQDSQQWGYQRQLPAYHSITHWGNRGRG